MSHDPQHSWKVDSAGFGLVMRFVVNQCQRQQWGDQGVAAKKAKRAVWQKEEWTVKENKSQAEQDQLMTCHKPSQ